MVSHAPAGKSPVGGMPGECTSRGCECRIPPSPPPGICGARFLRQQEAGAFFFAQAQGSAAAVPKPKVMHAAADSLVSPELVLVSPDLRARALAQLPTIDPDALFRVAPRPAPIPRRVEARPPLPMAIAAYVAEAVFLGAIRGGTLILLIAAAAFLAAR
jgi:hypothetical protein